MSSLSTEVPILVTYRSKQGYGLRPLFFPMEPVWHKRYAHASELLQRQLKRDFAGYRSNRESIAKILWLTFCPEFSYRTYQFDVRRKKELISAAFGVVQFSLHGEDYAVFPLLGNEGILLQSKESEEAQLEEFVKKYFRKRSKRYAEDGFAISRHFSDLRDHCAQCRATVDVVPGAIELGSLSPSFFSTMFEGFDFDGPTEIRRVGRDLSELYPEGLLRAYCREELSARLSELLFERAPGCLALVGPRGSGKTTLIHSSLRKHLETAALVEKSRPRKIWHVDPLRIISGMSIIGMWQARLESIVRFLIKRRHNKRSDVFYVDNPVSLFRIGKSSQNELTVADALRPYLERRAVSMLVEATEEQWTKVQELDRRFADLFQVVRVEPAAKFDAIEMFSRRRSEVELKYDAEFSTEALQVLWPLLERHGVEKSMPGAACDALQELAASKKKKIDAGEVMRHFSETLHFSTRILDQNKSLAPADVSRFIDRRLIGQARAKVCLGEVIHRIKAGMCDPQKPLASLLFTGPTGVGKTEAAKILCEFLFDSPAHLVRFNMNEFIDATAVSRLIGDGIRPEGQLTSKVRYKRACVLLLDEIEKAHESVHDLLLQVLGEARLTDALGQTTDFSQCVIVMTSNLGSQELQRKMGFGTTSTEQDAVYKSAIRRFFRPELIGRIDHTVIFEQLSSEEIEKISAIMLQRILGRDGLKRRSTFLSIKREAVEQIALGAHEPELGARALRRNLERSIVSSVATQLAPLTAEQPIVLKIELKESKLVPTVTPIDYIEKIEERLPKIGEEEITEAYETLGQRVSATLDRIHGAIDTHPERQMQYWVLAEGLKGLGERVEKICSDISRWRKRQRSGSFELKYPADYGQWRRVSNADSVWQTLLGKTQDLRHVFSDAEPLSNYIHGRYLQHYLDWRFQEHIVEAGLRDEASFATIEIKSLAARIGEDSVAFLKSHYLESLSNLDIAAEVTKSSDETTVISVEAPAISQVLKGEAGLHLFMREEESIPIQVSIGAVGQESNGNFGMLRVLRLYDIDDQEQTILDLRSGLICQKMLAKHDWKLFFWYGFANGDL